MQIHFSPITRLLLPLLLCCFLGTSVRAQIKITRQVIATSVFSATPEGNRQRLKMTATAGEVFVGTKRGTTRATVGFQQPDDDVLVSIVTVGNRQLTVRAFPNPTIDQLTVDLGEASGEFTELLLLDLHGRTMVRRRVITPVLHFPEVANLPGGTYFLRGKDQVQVPVDLGKILITAH